MSDQEKSAQESRDSQQKEADRRAEEQRNQWALAAQAEWERRQQGK